MLELRRSAIEYPIGNLPVFFFVFLKVGFFFVCWLVAHGAEYYNARRQLLTN